MSNAVGAVPDLNCTVDISGKVNTVGGYGIPGVDVTAVGLSVVAITDPNGGYTLSVPLGWTDGTVQVARTDSWFEPAERFYAGPVQDGLLEQDYVGRRWADFNGSGVVELRDYALMADQWLVQACETHQDCDGTDLDLRGTVDSRDLQLLILQWLDSR